MLQRKCHSETNKDIPINQKNKPSIPFFCVFQFFTCCSIGTSQACKKSKDIAPFFFGRFVVFHSFRIMSNLGAQQEESLQTSKVKNNFKEQ